EAMNEEPGAWAKKAGFWIGLGLFVAILLAPEIPPLTAPRSAPPAVEKETRVVKPDASAATRGALTGKPKRALAATVLIATWWITSPIPMPITSLLPLALLPLLGVSTASAVSQAYSNDSLYLFMGGFMLALGIERWGLHRRLALWVLSIIGGSPRRIVLGMM